MVAVDLVGRVFSRLTVVARAPNDKYSGTRWECLCSCGGKKVIARSQLVLSGTKSCGCLYRETRRSINTTHGSCGTPEYVAWVALKQRCSNPGQHGYQNYGGRGIKVCDRWVFSFENFYADMGDRPSKYHSVDRIDNDGNYEPGNCKWSTRVEQRKNQRKYNKAAMARIEKLEADLLECREYLADHMDVVDGSYGEPSPNKPMRLVTMIDETLGTRAARPFFQGA